MSRRQRIGRVLTVLAVLTAVVLTALTPTASAAATYRKSYRLTETADGTGIVHDPEDTPAFWEYPQLLAGQSRLDGVLTLANDTDQDVRMRLDGIGLPYENESALTYLNYLTVTVRDGDAVLYDGLYCHIADADGGLKLETPLKAGERHDYALTMSCAFDLPADVNMQSAATAIEWRLIATSESKIDRITGFDWSSPWGLAVLAVVILLLVVVIALTVRARLKKSKKSAKNGAVAGRSRAKTDKNVKK